MRIYGNEDPAKAPESWAEDPPPDAVAWREAWNAALTATEATDLEGDVDPQVAPLSSEGEFSAWALGRHADGETGLWKITMEFDHDGSVDWMAEDMDEGSLPAPPIAFLQKVPYRESEAANRAAWAAGDPNYEPFAPPDEDVPS